MIAGHDMVRCGGRPTFHRAGIVAEPNTKLSARAAAEADEIHPPTAEKIPELAGRRPEHGEGKQRRDDDPRQR